MKKWIIIILMLMMLQGVFAATQIEISTDNATWQSIDTTHYGGNIDDTNDRAYVHTLNASTTYYIRSKNSTTSWKYQTIETESGGLDQMELSMILGIGIVAAICLFFAFNLDKEHFLLKLLLVFFGLGMLIFIPSTIINGETATATPFLRTTLWLFRLFGIYFMGYIFYHWAKKSEKLVSMMERAKSGFR